jgi:hypothetical protein
LPPPDLSPLQRLALAFYAFFAVLFRIEVAVAVHRIREVRAAGQLTVGEGAPAATPAATPTSTSTPAATPTPTSTPTSAPPPGSPVAPVPVPAPARPDARPALQLLALLQREGRLVDFLEEDLSGFPDASVGAAARTVHAGCKRALEQYVRLEPVLKDAEGAQVTVPRGFDAAAIRLTGNVVGDPPFKGSLRHHGWRAREVTLPPPRDGADAALLAPAEVEL